ncbi:Serine phosphatase RsbU, regulator of sigma subunit [Blastococcus sp. DSM 46786]|uniref:PP2C family protein-serine/threonine phosphatase n=1 Tax=Blastococcus sp. DSM 46786 TaxID=1798227 RepID=UPI0008C3D379|nr:PP2C family protein-serine/threonine phosphatase [Blastococcus sp. DSM 46786]SEL92749.1 Serine phosphatase RsbU, regulator of sigma subunit [Blastococcus sp. DSM 46786]
MQDAQHPALAAGYAHADLSLEQLWVRYFALGGTADLMEVDAYLHGLAPVPSAQHDLLAHAVNERLDELLTRHRVPYTRTIRAGRPATGPLAAVLALLEVAGTAPPERIPGLVVAAGRMLGVEVTVHRIDHEQRCLVRLGATGTAGRRRLGVESTMAGRAFRTVQVVSSDRDGRPRLWVPVVDGADRLGVLEVRVENGADLDDPALRDQCRWLASLLGHVLASMEVYGDGLERPRRTRPMSPSAELIWQQLPPLTAATESFVLAGRLEPTYDVGGDAFDYALSEQVVSLGIFDAVGHGLHAALMAGAALAGYRSARRDGRSVFDQARAIDDVVSASFPGSQFVTGVIGEVDVDSGRLRYVNAGHPSPLLLRGGRVVKELDGGRRVPFGLEARGLTIGEEMLQPGDWLALHTDGITEARDAGGTWFGERRLAEFLTRAIGAGQPPAETVRRLTAAVLEHQGGLLQDDASVLLARWKLP